MGIIEATFYIGEAVCMAKLRLKQILAERNMPMERFSRHADISSNTILQMCNNPGYDPKLSMLNKVAQTLNIPVAELLEPEEWEKKKA
jgi:transcriptional regulator with XRE-family HTH domain